MAMVGGEAYLVFAWLLGLEDVIMLNTVTASAEEQDMG